MSGKQQKKIRQQFRREFRKEAKELAVETVKERKAELDAIDAVYKGIFKTKPKYFPLRFWRLLHRPVCNVKKMQAEGIGDLL